MHDIPKGGFIGGAEQNPTMLATPRKAVRRVPSTGATTTMFLSFSSVHRQIQNISKYSGDVRTLMSIGMWMWLAYMFSSPTS